MDESTQNYLDITIYSHAQTDAVFRHLTEDHPSPLNITWHLDRSPQNNPIIKGIGSDDSHDAWTYLHQLSTAFNLPIHLHVKPTQSLDEARDCFWGPEASAMHVLQTLRQIEQLAYQTLSTIPLANRFAAGQLHAAHEDLLNRITALEMHLAGIWD